MRIKRAWIGFSLFLLPYSSILLTPLSLLSSILSMSNSIDWSDPPPQQRVDQQQQKNGSDGNQSSGKLDPGVFTERECEYRSSL